eukprot:13351_1
MYPDEHHTTITLCALIFNLALCYPQSIYVSYKLYANWNEMYFIKRRRFITLCLVISTVFFQLCTSQLVIWKELYYDSFIITITAVYAAHAVTFAFVILYITRMWCLHYDHQMYELSNHKLWHSIINNAHFENNWYIKHRSTRGNDRWLLFRIGAPVFIMSSFLHIALHITIYGSKGTSVTMARDSVTFLLVLCFVVIGIRLWSQFPKLHDTMLIRKELKMCVWIMLLSMFVYLLVTLTVGKFMTFFVPMATHIAVLHVLVLYPIRNVNGRNDVHVSTRDERSDNMYKSWIYFVNNGDNKSELNAHNYCIWMAFLAREFSIENLLFVTEYVQLKRYVISTMNMAEIEQNVTGYCDALCLPTSQEFPVSEIVKQYETSQRTLDAETCFMNAVISLYTKYIAQRTAMHQINISYVTRIAIVSSLFGNGLNAKMTDEAIMTETIHSESTVSDGDLSKKMVSILKQFEAAADEVSRLMRSSFRRFKIYQVHRHSET